MLFKIECDSLKITVSCRLMHGDVVRPFFFNKPATNETTYLQIMQDHVIALLPNLSQVMFQRDSAPQHWV